MSSIILLQPAFCAIFIVFLQECALKKNELKALRTQTEHEALEKRQLEDSVMEKMMQRLTMDKATKYTRKTVDQLHRRAQELVSVCVSGVCGSVCGWLDGWV